MSSITTQSTNNAISMHDVRAWYTAYI